MTATAHAVIGTIIAAKIGNPGLAIPLAFASHIVLDTIPHWDTATNGRKKEKIKKIFKKSVLDVVSGFILSFGIIIFLFPDTNIQYAFLLILVSQSLDWLTAPYYFLNIKFPPFFQIYKFQKMFDRKMDKPWGIITQVAIILLLITLAKTF